MKLKIFLPACLIIAIFIISCEKSSSLLSSGDTKDALSIGGGSPGNSGGGTAGVITAGEWNDTENWSFWNTLLQRDTIKDFPAIWGFYTKNKVSVILKDGDNKVLHDAQIIMKYNGTTSLAVTDNFGKAELFANLFQPGFLLSNFNLQAKYRGQVYDLGMHSNNGEIINKSIPVLKTINNTLDIMFTVDATGSMGDEISYLKTELLDVINRAGSQLPGIQINMGSVFYRDKGDDYLTRPFNFTTAPQQLINFINQQQAGGGGDTPEAVDEALKTSIQDIQWSSNAVNRLLFLILDAPPHKTQENLSRLTNAIKAAQEKGIRIIPVSASGIDWETEFLLRFMSVSTNSTYVFITNHSGIGNPHLSPTVGNYTVEYLNNLMVRLITKYGKNQD